MAATTLPPTTKQRISEPPGFLDVLLEQNVGVESAEGLDDAFARLEGFCQHHPHTLGAFQELNDHGRAADQFDQVAGIVRGMRETGHGQPDTLARKQLQ